jgi:oleandomycin transport system ATP-binding protein
VAAAVTEIAGVRPDVRQETGLVTAAVSDPAMVPAVVRRLDDEGIVPAELALRLPSLDEVFLTLTGHLAEERDGNDEAGRAA